ncbi:hypothetical protein [Rhodoplanes sp. SY1]
MSFEGRIEKIKPKIELETCPDCKGKGEKDGKTCPRCSGSGKLRSAR